MSSGPIKTIFRRWRRRILPNSLYGRTFLIIVAPFALLQVVATFIFYDAHWETLSRRLGQTVAGDITYTIELLEHGPLESWGDIARRGERHTTLRMEVEPLGFLDRSASEEVDSVEASLLRALDERLKRPYRLKPAPNARHMRVEIQLAQGVLAVEVPRKRLFTTTTYAFVLWMIGTAILLVNIALLFMRNQLRPVRRLADAAESFGKGGDVADFKPEGASEIKRAGDAFVRMRDRIQRQIAQRTDMLNGVSHDLRTPLTRMRLQLEMMGDDPDVRDLKGDVVEMERMLEGYLAFARGEGTEQASLVELAGLVAEIVRNAARTGADIRLGANPPCTRLVKADALRRAITNLVANACRHGTIIVLHATLSAEGWTLTIDDDGPGIPADRREEAFRPFVRLEQARTLATGGIGLGLTVARDVLRSHGGDIDLGNAPLGGLRAVVWLPA